MKKLINNIRKILIIAVCIISFIILVSEIDSILINVIIIKIIASGTMILIFKANRLI